jgi:hypothetical protein
LFLYCASNIKAYLIRANIGQKSSVKGYLTDTHLDQGVAGSLLWCDL